MIVEIRQLGGAMGRVPEGAGALDKIDGKFLAFTGGMVTAPGDFEVARARRTRGDGGPRALQPRAHVPELLRAGDQHAVRLLGGDAPAPAGGQGPRRPDGLLHGNHRIEAAAS